MTDNPFDKIQPEEPSASSLPTNDDAALELSPEDFTRSENFTQPAIVIPGPGLPESLGWIVGMMVVQVVASIVIVVILLFAEVGANGVPNLENMTKEKLSVLEKAVTKKHKATIIGVTQGISAVVILFAVVLRLGGVRKAIYRLPVAPLRGWHFLLILILFVPLLTFSSQWHMLLSQFWNDYVLVIFPDWKSMDKMSSMELLKEMVTNTPLWALLMMMAVAPAVTEELIFRGLIGRGLVARWGVVAGVMLTSFLFAIVHLAPVHVLALIPLAIVLHLLHLATRSIWAPMLLHFMNNAIAVIAMKFAVTTNPEAIAQAAKEAANPQFSLVIFIGSGLCLAALCWLIWSVRYRYRYPAADGTDLPVGYTAAEVPERWQQSPGTYGPIQSAPVIASITGTILFIASIVYYSWEMIVKNLNE